MSGEEKKAGDTGTGAAAASVPTEQPYLDEHTTEPNAPTPAAAVAPPQSTPQKWEMPKPKFQQTSGYLPQGYLKEVNVDGDGTAGGPVDGQDEQLTAERITGVRHEPIPAQATPAIEPQPDLLDQLIPEEPLPATNTAPGTPRGGSRVAFLLLGLVGILLFLAIFLAAVYYFFLMQPAGGTNF
jgi:hypothetical protein